MVAPSRKPIKKTRVRISKSGQITLPAGTRKRLGVDVGDQVEVNEYADGEVSVLAVKTVKADDIAGMFGPRPSDLDIDDVIRESTRAGMQRRLNRD